MNATGSADLAQAALDYARRGWAVLPLHTVSDGICSCGNRGCNSPGKHPRTAHGASDATTDEATIRAWWDEFPDANVGIHAGRSGFVVVDVDPRHGGTETWRELCTQHEIPDDTVTALTGGGGRHVYFGANGIDPSALRGSLGPGVDVKRGNSYVVAPPSIHPSGARYEWEVSGHPDDIDPLPLPPSLRLLLVDGDGRGRAAPEIDERIPAGKRNETLASLAGTMRRRRASEDAILAALKEENAHRCDPPLGEREVERIARSIARYDPEPEHTRANLTDLGNGQRFVARHGDEMRFCHPWRRWLVWDGIRWVKDETGQVQRWARDTVRSVYAEASNIPDDEGRKAAGKWATRSENAFRLRAMVELAQAEPGIPVLPADLDRGPFLFNVRNGTINLRTGELRPHDPSNLITKLAPVLYDPRAECPTWHTFLDRIMGGNRRLIGYLQRESGYALTGDTSEQCISMRHGLGANGKSTYENAVTALMGDYAVRTPVETLMVKRGRGIPNDIARLKGARLVTAAEAEEGHRLAESLVKSMTGGDKLTARFLHAEWFEFTPTFKIWLSTNHKPAIRGTDHAIWRRIRLVPFNVTIPPEEQDLRMLEKLLAELDGIFMWALEGCIAWQAHGLQPPPEVLEATELYRAEMDAVSRFLEECCATGSSLRVQAGQLYERYKTWCTQNGERIINSNRFGRRMTAHRIDRVKDGYVFYIGVGLLAEEAPP